MRFARSLAADHGLKNFASVFLLGGVVNREITTIVTADATKILTTGCSGGMVAMPRSIGDSGKL
jgi:hypothetical protein